ncbi:MAG: LytR/AlgR family response regulator transcription factor [Candidatus Cryptobacteroides sp.]
MIRCVAIDDEPIALDVLRRFCARRGGVELETYSSPRAGMQRIEEWKPDLVFLDIELNGDSGVELARRLPPSCALVFTTAFAHYALEGFEVEAVDFLHKPFFYDRFDRAMNRVEEHLRMKDLLGVSAQPSRQLLLKSDYKTVKVPIDSILYVESINNYVRIHLADSESVLSKTSLKSIESQLPGDDFVRIHRSYLVARKRIALFSRSEVVLSKSGKHLPVGPKYIDSLGQGLSDSD